MISNKTITLFLLFTTILLASVQIFASSLVTKEEAIEISRSSGLVRALLEEADLYTLEVHYLNQTKEWLVMWYIHPMDAVSSFRYGVSHRIDGETGEILYEGTSSIR